MAERRYIDQPYIVEITTLEQVQQQVQPLTHAGSPLPLRMRSRLAYLARRCSLLARELRRAPEAVALERAREDEAAARRPLPPP